MTRKQFLGLVLASPLAILLGKREEPKQDITQGQYLYAADFGYHTYSGRVYHGGRGGGNISAFTPLLLSSCFKLSVKDS